jgi:hypothetical protein
MRRSVDIGSAGVVALLLCVGPVLTAAHELVTTHRFCEEHQALEETSEGSPSAGGPVAGDPREGATGSRALAGDAATEHAGCPLAQALASGLQVPHPPVGVAAPEAPPARIANAHTGSRFPPTAVLAFAPKTSPPPSAV